MFYVAAAAAAAGAITPNQMILVLEAAAGVFGQGGLMLQQDRILSLLEPGEPGALHQLLQQMEGMEVLRISLQQCIKGTEEREGPGAGLV